MRTRKPFFYIDKFNEFYGSINPLQPPNARDRAHKRARIKQAAKLEPKEPARKGSNFKGITVLRTVLAGSGQNHPPRPAMAQKFACHFFDLNWGRGQGQSKACASPGVACRTPRRDGAPAHRAAFSAAAGAIKRLTWLFCDICMCIFIFYLAS
jgi:hypothetical protein